MNTGMANIWHCFWTLYFKEWMRIKRNPAALMSVGLLVLVAYLISIETKSQVAEVAVQKKPCVIAYNMKDSFINQLESQLTPEVLLIQTDLDLTKQVNLYPKGTSCVAQYANDKRSTKANLLLLHSGDTTRIYQLLRKFYSVELQGAKLIKSATLNIKETEKRTTTIDLSSNKSRAMVWSMLLFSLHFFVGCALFISFTAHERERGILQALALTPASLNVIWLAKALFHLSLSLTASAVMLWVLLPAALKVPLVWIVLFFSILGLIAVATIITSLNRTQTSASLIGFCYLMSMSVIFSLSQNFPAFSVLRQFMFENHVIKLLGAIFDASQRNANVWVLHLYAMVGLVLTLTAIALFVWNKRALKSH
jgi:ABC-type Na+ efflux pump permease subunit